MCCFACASASGRFTLCLPLLLCLSLSLEGNEETIFCRSRPPLLCCLCCTHPCSAACNTVLLCSAACNTVILCPAACNKITLCSAACKTVILCAAVCNRVILCSAICNTVTLCSASSNPAQSYFAVPTQSYYLIVTMHSHTLLHSPLLCQL